jgi:hypothetical protein
MCAAKSDVRFAPVSDRESGFPQKVMSALPPKADMCVALAYVRFGPKAYSFSAAIGIATRSLHRRAPKNSSAARCPCILAVLRLRTNSTLVACWTGMSAGFSPFRIRPVAEFNLFFCGGLRILEPFPHGLSLPARQPARRHRPVRSSWQRS